MQVTMRSNDAFKAAYMNMFAFTELQRDLAKRLSDRLDRPILPGCYTHFANSYHIYGSYFKEFEERFINALKDRTFEQRTMPYEAVKPMMEEAIPGIREKADKMCRDE